MIERIFYITWHSSGLTDILCYLLIEFSAAYRSTSRWVAKMETRCVADVEGPWVDPAIESSLIERCRCNWSVPVGELTNYMLATFIRQRIALNLVVPEARHRLMTGFTDDTELYGEELAVAVAEVPVA